MRTPDPFLAVLHVEAERDRYRRALETIAGPSSDGADLIEVYRAAGGGYEGLQAVAEAALRAGDR